MLSAALDDWYAALLRPPNASERLISVAEPRPLETFTMRAEVDRPGRVHRAHSPGTVASIRSCRIVATGGLGDLHGRSLVTHTAAMLAGTFIESS